MDKKLTKVTEFIGYLSGDGECSCLSSEISEHGFSRGEEIQLDELFPDEVEEEHGDKISKWKFKITIEAERVDMLTKNI